MKPVSLLRLLRLPSLLLGVALVAGCAIVDKPVRAVVYDFGPGATPRSTAATTATATPAMPVVLLPEIDAGPALDNTAVLYRLAYADAQQLQPYAQARWSMTPAQLLGQRLRERLAQQATVLTPGDSTVGLGSTAALVLQVELEEFSQVFDAPASSAGLVRMRATAVRSVRGIDQLLGQRSFQLQRPASSADARGGVHALTQASDAAVEDIAQWLTSLR